MELASNHLRDFTLNREEIGHIPIIGLRPDMCVGVRVDELRVNSEPVADSLDVSFQKVGDTQLLPDLT